MQCSRVVQWCVCMSDVYSNSTHTLAGWAVHWKQSIGDMSKDGYVTYNANCNNISTQLINHHKVFIFALKLPLKGDKNDMVNQMARAKYLGDPFMAYLENL